MADNFHIYFDLNLCQLYPLQSDVGSIIVSDDSFLPDGRKNPSKKIEVSFILYKLIEPDYRYEDDRYVAALALPLNTPEIEKMFNLSRQDKYNDYNTQKWNFQDVYRAANGTLIEKPFKPIG